MTTETTPQISPVAQIRALHDRLIKAEGLVASNKVHSAINMPGYYIVEGNTGFYIVNGTCCCDDATNRSELIKSYCKHRLAAVIYAEQQALADNPKVSKAVNKTTPPESDRTLEDQLADLYPKPRPTNSLR
jgi:hypothetical protein